MGYDGEDYVGNVSDTFISVRENLLEEGGM